MLKNLLGGLVSETTVRGMVQDAIPGAVQEILQEAMSLLPSSHRTDDMRLFVAQEIVIGMKREIDRMERNRRIR